ncbi:armadillo repeat-containing protein 5 [Cyprinodon tularosa]|uniref:armadillo repeat-containing protein 5 n=1 Tax=Cyprinodon tularosa TaxID=77115 RepID=UPI0018E25E18|nr:armadillo repeat-containing protein 5 [Cyprinodon tularosa]
MASSPVKGEGKQQRVSPKEGQPPSPESSLTWCLDHLCKPGLPVGAEHQTGSSKDTDKRSKLYQWRALVAIRTQHIKGDKAGIARFRGKGGLKLLLKLLKHPECPRKILDLALSILANCCTEQETRLEVRKLEGINIVVDIMKRNVALETVQNRAARALGNLAMDQESSALIHSAGGIPLLLLCVSVSASAPSSPTAAPSSNSCPKLECAQSAARALLYLSDSPSNRLSLLTQGTLSALAPLIAPEYPSGLRHAALRTLNELTKGCGIECAREVSRSGVLTQLGVMASGGEQFEELALKTLANMCSQGCLRPFVGSLGVIQKFTEEIKKDPLKSGVFLKALCWCCKEAVNRAKVKESGGLEVLMNFLSSHQNHPLSKFIILACVDFVFDESAMEQLAELGLVPVLVALLVKLTRGEEDLLEKVDVSSSSNMPHNELLSSSFLESFDYPPAEVCRREEAGREQGSSSFLSLRSWLLSEGLISSEGELLDSSTADAEWGTLNPPSSSPQTSSPNPDSSQSPKAPSSSSSNKTAPPLSPLPSLSSSSSITDPSPSTGITPPNPTASPSVCSPTNTSQTPISPSKLSSSQKRRRMHSATSLTKFAIDSPPTVPRTSTYQHPYHPEPWTQESPILLLLSRFSHASDPSSALVSAVVMSGLLCYITQHQDPSSRCFRMLCRLSCNPSCLQALVRTGSVALIRHHLCLGEDRSEKRRRQTDRVKAKVKQLGDDLLNNLRVQCESSFGSGVLTHVMLSGSESDKMSCALSLPFISSNKSLLRKLLLDCGGLFAALRHLDCEFDDEDEEHHGRLLSELFKSPHSDVTSLYFSLLLTCLSALTGAVRTKLGEKNTNPTPAGDVERDSAPPLKKPRLADSCPYGSSEFDLVLLLDDGTRIPASKEAVAGVEDADEAGSEYFRALLRGGFGEAEAEEAIRIKDVSAGMLLPLLHYLHGCRFSSDSDNERSDKQARRHCQTLDSVVVGVFQNETGEPSTEGFQTTPLCELMIGACRFLVKDLKSELEDIFVSFLLSWSNAGQAKQGDKKDNAKKTERDQKSSDPAEDNLADLTSELELTAGGKKLNGFLQQLEGKEMSSTGSIQKGITGLDRTVSKTVSASEDQSVSPEGKLLGPKNRLKFANQDSCSSSEAALSALLPQLYWFSQRYSYPTLGRTCLALLLGFQDCPRPFVFCSVAADCFRRLAREADCTETLKQDLLCLVSAALV